MEVAWRLYGIAWRTLILIETLAEVNDKLELAYILAGLGKSVLYLITSPIFCFVFLPRVVPRSQLQMWLDVATACSRNMPEVRKLIFQCCR